LRRTEAFRRKRPETLPERGRRAARPRDLWGQLVELEPQVETLLWQARLAGANCRTFADVDRAFNALQYELTGLIGFVGKHHRHPVLGSAGAYEVAYWKLYDAVAGLVPDHTGDGEEAPKNQ
jgi:hypothetical protein